LKKRRGGVMTAEIAILNKTAVALATDSAVTISAADRELKIYDSADKLFELSHTQPIGLMIYNGMTFSGIPLASLIKQFRDQCGEFDRVEEAAGAFMQFLHRVGRESPDEVKAGELKRVVQHVLTSINDRFILKLTDFQEKITKGTVNTATDFKSAVEEMVNSVIEAFARILRNVSPGSFVGSKRPPAISSDEQATLGRLVAESLVVFSSPAQERVVELLITWLKSSELSPSLTGLVFSGFGTTEKFPTLVSYQTDGLVLGRLKYVETNKCDIDRLGVRAAVIPFAQKEMVERFLYGLDDDIKRNITQFCKRTVPSIRQELVESLDFEDDAARGEFEKRAKEKEDAFLDRLTSDAFEMIREGSKRDIEEMVEFMPKPEMATMAEALVNLTSIKRKVSRGMETVGGPIDVAVISQSEGLVWVKRKHYFPAELNLRHAERVRIKLSNLTENGHAPRTRKAPAKPLPKQAG
jgi:hypothetical protein